VVGSAIASKIAKCLVCEREEVYSLRVGHRPDGHPLLINRHRIAFPRKRDPFIRLLSALKGGPGFSRGKRFYRIAPWTILFLLVRHRLRRPAG